MLNATIDFKEELAEARRTQILMGAAQIFSQKGYHQATTKEIAAAAEVSEGTIYTYFDTKRDLLVAMMELLGRWSLAGLVRENPPDEPKAFLATLLQDLYQLLQERGDFVAAILAEILTDTDLRQALYHQLVQPVASYVENFLESHTPLTGGPRPEPLVTAYALIGAMLLTVILKESQVDARFDTIPAEAVIERLVSIFLDDLRANQELGWVMS